MSSREYQRRNAAWQVAFYRAMFENRIRYLGAGQFIGFSLIRGVMPRQLHLEY
jgi:hypothetical protein